MLFLHGLRSSGMGGCSGSRTELGSYAGEAGLILILGSVQRGEGCVLRCEKWAKAMDLGRGKSQRLS